MTAGDDLPLDVFALVERLLPGIALTSGQLAGVRAANTRYHTAVAALLAAMLDDLRGRLRAEQRAVFERNVGPRGR